MRSEIDAASVAGREAVPRAEQINLSQAVTRRDHRHAEQRRHGAKCERSSTCDVQLTRAPSNPTFEARRLLDDRVASVDG